MGLMRLPAAALALGLACGGARADVPPVNPPVTQKAAPPDPDEPVKMDTTALDKALRDGPTAADGVADAWAIMVKSLVALSAVLMLVYLVVGKGLGKLAQKQGTGRSLRVVDRVGLEPRKTLYLVEVDGVRTLVATTDNAVSMMVVPDGPAPSQENTDGPAERGADVPRGDA